MRHHYRRVASVNALLLLALLSGACYQRSDSPNSPISNPNEMKHQITGPVNYVALGDSTGAGIGARNGGYVARLFKRIDEARPGSRLLNLCVSGATSEDVKRDQLNRGIAAAPTLVTLGIGINDLGHGMSVEASAGNIDAILTRLRSETQATIVISNLPDISAAPRIPIAARPEVQRRIELLNQKIAEIGVRHGVRVFDIYSSTHQSLFEHPEYFSNDGFHPSDEGYEVWAEQMWPTVASALGL